MIKRDIEYEIADEFVLLRIAADLHAAAREPWRWPDAWQTVCAFFACPDIIGQAIPEGLPAGTVVSHIADRTARARACVEARNGTCVLAGDDQRFRACFELLPHLEMALAADSRAAGNAGDPRLAALDVLPFPVFVCDGGRRLLHSNAAGRRELEQQAWLRLAGDCLVGASAAIERRLVAALARNQDQRLGLLQDGNIAADLICRQITRANAEPYWVLRLVRHALEEGADAAQLAVALRLTPRQVELAQLLIAGCTLTEAAKRMGIVRGSANDLLKHLFTATGTRRQAELVGYLNRRLASR